jgi:hypothetical protein
MFSSKKGSTVKVIDWGTSRKFDPKIRMRRLVGTVQFYFSLVIFKSLIIWHQKF